ncbi:hypothetical protein AAZX31_01G059900 [Glycine max]
MPKYANRVLLLILFWFTILASRFISSITTCHVDFPLLRLSLIFVNTLFKLSFVSLNIESSGVMQEPITTTLFVSRSSHAIQKGKKNVFLIKRMLRFIRMSEKKERSVRRREARREGRMSWLVTWKVP